MNSHHSESAAASGLNSQNVPLSITVRGVMDTAIDLSDASKALDLDNIRFQLMYATPMCLFYCSVIGHLLSPARLNNSPTN
jgi:hypothetical protein